LGGVPFPSMPKLLSSANGLVKLSLRYIPDSAYISPDAMATALTAMTRLETLDLQFCSLRYHLDPAGRLLPPSTRFVLPALNELTFEGVYQYLEDLLARFDAPLLYYLYIEFFMDLNFEVPQLHRLIGHAEAFKEYSGADLLISHYSIELSLYPKAGVVDHRQGVYLYVKSSALIKIWQLSSLAQIWNSTFPLISTLEKLRIREYHWGDDMESARCLEFLYPFTGLKDLYLTDGIAQRVMRALQELSGERAAEVLPALRNLFVDESIEHIQEAIGPFVAARQLSGGHPVAINYW